MHSVVSVKLHDGHLCIVSFKQFAALLKLLVFNKVESSTSILLYNSFSSHILVTKNLAHKHILSAVMCWNS